MKFLTLICALMCSLCIGAKERMTVLPSIKYSTSPAKVNGVIKNYTTTVDETVLIQYLPFGGSELESISVAISAATPQKASDATFTADVPLLYSDRVAISFRDKTVTAVLVPGEETGMTIDLKSLYDTKAKKPAITYTGSMGDFNTDLATYAGEYDSQTPFAAFASQESLKAMSPLTIDTYKQKVMDAYNKVSAELQADKRLCGAFKQYVDATYKYNAMVRILTAPYALRTANGSQELEKVPANYYDEIKAWNVFGENGILYAFQASEVGRVSSMISMNLSVSPAPIPQGYEQLQLAQGFLTLIGNGTPLNDSQLSDLDNKCTVLKDIVLKENAALVAHIEENLRNPQFFVHELDSTLTGEDIFKALIAPYKGQPLLVDFWATWCGPCKAAMKTILPVKEELKGKAHFVYLTGPTSPKDAWNTQIPDIHGDHYYVTNAQWRTLLDQFESQGIPTYVVVDKDGNIVNKHIGYPGNEVMMEELTR